MLQTFTTTATHIYFSCGFTDFRKQTESLSALISTQFKLDPYRDDCVFVFCNRKKNAIQILRYDHNGFILASKKLLDDMKFQWPKTPDEVKEVTQQQLRWLLDGLSIEQKKAHHDVKMPNIDFYNHPEEIEKLLPWFHELPKECQLTLNYKSHLKK